MAKHDLIVIGASAGGIEALQTVMAGLPADLPASVLVILHTGPAGGGTLARILTRMTQLPVVVAVDGEPLQPGRVYVASGDRHLLVGEGHAHVRKGPRENGHRPAIDPLFRSAAAYYGSRAIGVVLSGTLSDGTSGLYAIKSRGGVAVVQKPSDALYPGMPTSALDHVDVDHISTADELGALLGRLASEEVEDSGRALDRRLKQEVELMESDDRVVEDQHPGLPSPWPCPDCSGVLWEIEEGHLIRYRCRVGHAWTAKSLLQEQARGVEGALWMALRALEDRAALSQKLAERAESGGRPISARRHRDELQTMQSSIDILRTLLNRDDAGFELGEEDPGPVENTE